MQISVESLQRSGISRVMKCTSIDCIFYVMNKVWVALGSLLQRENSEVELIEGISLCDDQTECERESCQYFFLSL